MAQPADTPPLPRADEDWAAQVTDSIDNVVTTLRDKTTIPLTTVARAIVYGLLAAVMGTTALVLLAVAAVRALDAYLPQEVWLPYLIVGGVFSLAGLFAWGKRKPKQKG